eukprot:464367_1
MATSTTSTIKNDRINFNDHATQNNLSNSTQNVSNTLIENNKPIVISKPLPNPVAGYLELLNTNPISNVIIISLKHILTKLLLEAEWIINTITEIFAEQSKYESLAELFRAVLYKIKGHKHITCKKLIDILQPIKYELKQHQTIIQCQNLCRA